MSYKVRKATLDDMPVLLKYEQGIIKAERPMDPTIKDGSIEYYNIPDFIQNNDSELLVVEFKTEIVASGYANIKSDRAYLKHKKQGYLGFMYVDERHRGRGVIKLIINGLFKWCKQKNIFEIRLDVYDDNIPAIQAYEKAGFKKHLINMRMNIQNKNV